MKQIICEHLSSIVEIKETKNQECNECVKTGSQWVHLRTCQECGVTLCCDSSINQHATKHFQSTSHPVVSSAEIGEKWLWCYEDEKMVGY